MANSEPEYLLPLTRMSTVNGCYNGWPLSRWCILQWYGPLGKQRKRILQQLQLFHLTFLFYILPGDEIVAVVFRNKFWWGAGKKTERPSLGALLCLHSQWPGTMGLSICWHWRFALLAIGCLSAMHCPACAGFIQPILSHLVCVFLWGRGLDSSVADPLPVKAVNSVWPRDRLSSAGMVVFYHVRFLVLENLRHFTLFGRFSFLTHPLSFWLSVAGILYDEILCDEIWLWKGRIGRQGITKECVSSLSPLANEKLQADSVSDNDILGENPGIKICSCILNWPHPPHNNDSVLQVNSSREHLTINQKTAVSSLICSQHSTFAPRLTARFGQCPISFEIWYSLGNGH